MLEPEHEVHAEVSVPSALRRIMQGELFDLILCDLMMPEVSGIDFYDELSRIAPELAQRVVFITGGVFTDRARAFLARAGARCLESRSTSRH